MDSPEEQKTVFSDPVPKSVTTHRKRSLLIKVIERFIDNPNFKTSTYFWLDILLNIVIIVSLVFIIRTYIISPFQVFGPSMCDTLNSISGQCNRSYGEYLIVNKFGYQNFFGWQVGLPARGDIIVFHPPMNESEFFIKRVIGLPGETVKLKDGKIFIYNKERPEGFELRETYLNSSNSGNTHPYDRNHTSFEIPEESYFVLGDNRIASSDARSCFQETAGNEPCSGQGKSPYLALDHIEGRAWVILWPLSKIQLLPNPEY
jgi:signal peptidase I